MIEIKIIAALLQSVQNAHGLVFNTRALRLTLQKVNRRYSTEGMGFLTKTLPRLGKALDKALAGNQRLNSAKLGFKAQPNSELPIFMGEFFNRVLQPNGEILPDPCELSVGVLRDVLYLFYKYELSYTDEQEQQVISSFKQTEIDLSTHTSTLQALRQKFAQEACEAPDGNRYSSWRKPLQVINQENVARRAKQLLTELFQSFDPLDINPRHGPGVVATKQRPHEKYLWTNVAKSITDMYPFDAYFCASAGHVCDSYQAFQDLTQEDLPARVLLVPKDSRGPRLISCEPVDKQWVQQGLGKAIVELVESHRITKYNVNFTDQKPNQRGAWLGSKTGRYATLDLNEASDRIHSDLVRLLFPDKVLPYLEACRSSSTELPSGEVIQLTKYAPMGSALCFPVLALTVWAILTAAAPDADTRDSVLVYGDDVIVPTAYAANAMEQLESFGLKINRDKSCISGLFRESCGMDAFRGKDVTPVRLRTVWSSRRSPDVYVSWISYANSFWDKQYYRVYDLIVEHLQSIYGPIPDDATSKLRYPSLRYVPDDAKPKLRRWNPNLQRLEYRVLEVKSPVQIKTIDGWSMLLRYFAEVANQRNRQAGIHQGSLDSLHNLIDPFSVGSYTIRRTSMLVRRWR